MDPGALPILAATVWFVVCLGYVLLAGMGTFWAVVWPEGQAVRRLRGLAVAGLALISLGTVGKALVDMLVDEYPRGETVTDESGTWLLVRLAVLAIAGFFGTELLSQPVRGARRVVVLALIVVLTITLVATSTAMASSQVVAIAATVGAYLLALAAWLGSLLAVAPLLVPHNRPAGLDQVWTRFSWLSGLSVLLLVVTGTAQHLIFGGTATSRSGVLLLIEVPVLVGSWALSRYVVAYGRRLAFREKYLSGLPVIGIGSGRRPTLGRVIGIQMILCVALLGVAVAQLAVLPVPGRPGTPALGNPGPTTPVATASEARPAASDTHRFIPERIELPGDASAAIVPVATVGRELVVPEDPGRVGWWDGSSYVGDPYGSTVIAGHVDTLDRGLGFFYRLWNIKVGERVVLKAGHLRQAYKITALRQVPRTDLVDDGVFDIGGPPRLVLITCAGNFRADRGGYSRNLIVVARPVS